MVDKLKEIERDLAALKGLCIADDGKVVNRHGASLDLQEQLAFDRLHGNATWMLEALKKAVLYDQG